MIDKGDIERKNFSLSLPAIIEKLDIFHELYLQDERGKALEDILSQSLNELRIINDTLYGKGGKQND